VTGNDRWIVGLDGDPLSTCVGGKGTDGELLSATLARETGGSNGGRWEKWL